MEDFRNFLKQNETKEKLKSLLLAEDVKESIEKDLNFDYNNFQNSVISKLKSDISFINNVKGDKGEDYYGYGGDGGLGYTQVHQEITSRLNGYYTISEVNAIVFSGADVDNYYTISQTDALINSVTVSANQTLSASLQNYYTKNQVDAISAFGTISAGNFTYFESDGTMVLSGDATVYDDLYPSSITIGSGTTTPQFTSYNGNLRAYEFLGTGGATLELNMGFQISHRRKNDTPLSPHLHVYVPNLATSGTIVFFCEYTWTNIGQVGTVNTTTISASVYLSANSGIQNNLIFKFPDINGTGKGISSMFMCRFYRTPSTASDTFTASVWLKSADIHIEMDTLGSRQEFIK